MKLNGTLLKSTVVAALGGLLFGFDTAVISGTTGALTQTYQLSPFLLGVTVFSALFGTVLGAMLAGFPGERFGRRDSLRVMAILYLISGLGCAFAWNWSALVAFRFIGGLGVGGSSVLGPMYIAEIAPARLRGRLVGFFQFNVVFGILVAYFSNYIISQQHFGEPSGDGNLESPRFQRRCSSLCCSPSLAVRAGWSRRDEWMKPEPCCG